MSDIRYNLQKIEERIRLACLRANRDPGEVKIVAVTKTVPPERIQEGIEAGISALGENRVQEAQTKYPIIGDAVQWHMIGHLQTNKVKKAVEIFHLIHSVDSLRLAERINKCALDIGKIQDILIQVNVSGEESKFGLVPEALEDILEEVSHLPGIRVRGLMTIAPMIHDPEAARPYFVKLRELAKGAAEAKISGITMDYLSMGMSGDFEVAVEEGANIVRVGTAIFGRRDA
jgi:pyridoxal phosphate enzyme (YggS family)